MPKIGAGGKGNPGPHFTQNRVQAGRRKWFTIGGPG